VGWGTPVIPALGRLRHENRQVKAVGDIRVCSMIPGKVDVAVSEVNLNWSYIGRLISWTVFYSLRLKTSRRKVQVIKERRNWSHYRHSL
jgi:hypothetical protein